MGSDELERFKVDAELFEYTETESRCKVRGYKKDGVFVICEVEPA